MRVVLLWSQIVWFRVRGKGGSHSRARMAVEAFKALEASGVKLSWICLPVMQRCFAPRCFAKEVGDNLFGNLKTLESSCVTEQQWSTSFPAPTSNFQKVKIGVTGRRCFKRQLVS